MNDINVLQRSPLLHAFLDGSMPEIKYRSTVIITLRHNGIYPNWLVFMKTIPDPQGAARKHYAMLQESCRKDVERDFGVLQKRFAIVKNLARTWKIERLNQIMKTCFILHDVIVEYQRSRPDPYGDDDFDGPPVRPLRNRHRSQGEQQLQLFEFTRTAPEDLPSGSFASMITRMKEIRDHFKFTQLQSDLITHIWKANGNLE
jgi:hypothetical protein